MAEQQGNTTGTKYAELFAALAAPFPPEQVRERSQGGRTFAYITCRTAANRLDDVLGPEGWWDRYKTSEKSVECELTIRLPDGTTLTKVDAGAYATMPDEGDNEKAGYSDAFKRAAAKFLVGRYLYRDGLPRFVYDELGIPGMRELNDSIQAGGSNGGGHQSSPRQDFGPPPPRQSAPQGNGGGYGNGNGNSNGQRNGGGSGGGRQFDDTQCPKHGRGLFAWCKGKQEKDGHDWVGDVNATIEEHFGRRMKMVDMSGEQVQEVWPLIAGSRNAQPAAALDRGNGDGIPF